MGRNHARRLAVSIAVLATVLAACGGGKTTTAPKGPAVTNRVSIDMTEFTFQTTGSITAGTASITVRNTGSLDHMAAFGLLKPGATALQAVDALTKNQDPSPFFAEAPDRTPFILTPGEKTEVITDVFKAGTYAMICFLPAADGALHAAKGMVSELPVKDATPAPVTIASDGDVLIGNGSITLPAKFSTGKGTFKVVGQGTEGHSLQIARLEPGKTVEDLDAYFTQKYDEGKPVTGAPPGQIAGATLTVKPGETLYVVIDLKAGSYVALCGDGDEGEEHEKKGERAAFTVA